MSLTHRRNRNSSSPASWLWTADEVQAEPPPRRLPVWAPASYREFESKLQHDLFPCLFARKSLRQRSQLFTFMRSFEPDALHEVREALVEYVERSSSLELSQRLLLPFVILVNPAAVPADLETCHRRGWSLLQYLHDHDVAPWAPELPTDPHHHLWSFCFAGVQLFVNFSAPHHAYHKARNLGSSMAFVINPRENFDVVGGDTPQGRLVRERIRARLEAYEGHPPPPELGTYSLEDNREWRQYALREPGVPSDGRCPLHIRRSRDVDEN